jgi:hypothetical protein
MDVLLCFVDTREVQTRPNGAEPRSNWHWCCGNITAMLPIRLAIPGILCLHDANSKKKCHLKGC